MAINFIPNDPRAGASAPAMRTQTPRANRPAGRSGFVFSNTSPEGVAAPGTPAFLFWQCREAAIAALEAWEASAGVHKKWQGNRSKLDLLQNDGTELNAFYDQQSFSFFEQTVGNATFFSGASTDVVAHEVGHGLLDSIRPDFFQVNFLEVGAFHEAFGDCIAILTALGDSETRAKVLSGSTDLRRRNFVESTAEDLSEGIKRLIPGHNAAEPRHAFNKFKFQIPGTLPSTGGPGALINEEHSFGMVFTGCFWDLIANVFEASPAKNEAALKSAAKTAGAILIAGAKAAPIAARFFQSVGRAMVLADEADNKGANREHIRDAFMRHNIMLGTNAMMAPSAALNGPAGAKLGAAAKKDLVKRLGGHRGARLAVSNSTMFGQPVVNAVYAREIDLGRAHKSLKGVVATALSPVLVGSSGKRAAVLGAMPNSDAAEAEVNAFVASLLANGRIDMGKSGKKKGFAASSAQRTTHEIKAVGGKKTLRRKRFNCGCGCGS